MSTHNIGFYEEISKIINELSSNTHIISSAAFSLFFGGFIVTVEPCCCSENFLYM